MDKSDNTKLPLGSNTSIGQGSWGWRRAFLFAVNGFCGAIIVIGLIYNPAVAFMLAIVYGSFGIMATSVLAYVFGAVVDDQLVRRAFMSGGVDSSSGDR